MSRSGASLELRYDAVVQWPPLAWLARCERGNGLVHLFHGTGLETAPDWFGEIVWAGEYPRAGFDRTDLVFGSGGRMRDEFLVFVSAASTLDRLHSLEDETGVWVSNSLPCLLAAVGATVDARYPRYYEDFGTIRRGLKGYRRGLATSAGPVRFIYYHNLAWDGVRLQEVAKPAAVRDFSSFTRYRDFLGQALRDLATNAGAPGRSHPYRLLATVSSGYDSPAVMALARPMLQGALSFDRARDGVAEGGDVVGAALGLPPTVIASDAWRQTPFAEVPFLAGDAKGEDVFFRGAEPLLEGAVVLTGFSGDKVWDRHTVQVDPDFRRSDQSGLSLTEYRLWARFIHCPVPFIGGRQVGAIRAISRSPELVPWDVGRGTGYSRPICRRIVEEAGVPRDAFGTRKAAASVLLFDRSSFLSPVSRTDYLDWLRRHGMLAGSEPAGAPPTTPRRIALAVAARVDTLTRNVRLPATRFVARAARRLAAWGRRQPMFRHLFPWALERAVARYALPEPLRERPAGTGNGRPK